MSARVRRVVVAAVLVSTLLAGCAGPSDYDPEAAERLQQQVLVVTTASAEGDWAAASTALLELEASAATALARGEITQARFDAIMAALALVRADVEAAAAAAAEQAEAEREAAEEAAEEAEEAEEDKGNGNSDKPGKPEKDD